MSLIFDTQDLDIIVCLLQLIMDREEHQGVNVFSRSLGIHFCVTRSPMVVLTELQYHVSYPVICIIVALVISPQRLHELVYLHLYPYDGALEKSLGNGNFVPRSNSQLQSLSVTKSFLQLDAYLSYLCCLWFIACLITWKSVFLCRVICCGTLM